MPLGLFLFFFFGGHLPQTSGFRSAKQILVVSFATQARAFILSLTVAYFIPPGGRGEQRRGLMPLGLSLFFFGWSLAPDLRFSLGQKILVVFFATQARGFILGDRNIFYTPQGGGGKQRRGLMPLGLFLFHYIFLNTTYNRLNTSKTHHDLSLDFVVIRLIRNDSVSLVSYYGLFLCQRLSVKCVFYFMTMHWKNIFPSGRFWTAPLLHISWQACVGFYRKVPLGQLRRKCNWPTFVKRLFSYYPSRSHYKIDVKTFSTIGNLTYNVEKRRQF